MVDTEQSKPQKSGDGNILSALISTLQQGVQAINNLTQTMKTIFPSS